MNNALFLLAGVLYLLLFYFILKNTVLPHWKWYRKLTGGTWYLYIDSFVYETETGVRTREVMEWTKVAPPKHLIIKTENYER
jgi:hypothetical protein